MKVPFNVLDRQFFSHQEEYESKALEVLRSGRYILGEEVRSFEEEFAYYVGPKYAVGVANGLDALVIAFRSLGIGPGDEVLVAANAYIACFMGISMVGATPIPVEPDEYYNINVAELDNYVNQRTRGVLAVHLYGQPCDMTPLKDYCVAKELFLVEDCAQSHGAMVDGVMTGSFGDVSCFSFYPSKNLGGFGDGGAIVTQDPELAAQARILRNYGSEKRYYNEVVGYNSRLDEIQAGLLRVKLGYMQEIIEEREELAARYLDCITNPLITLPKIRPGCQPVWHLFVVQVPNRSDFIEYMNNNDIAVEIHYPVPPHLSKAYRYLGHLPREFPIAEGYAAQVVSLPLYNGMTEEEINYVIETINRYSEES